MYGDTPHAQERIFQWYRPTEIKYFSLDPNHGGVSGSY